MIIAMLLAHLVGDYILQTNALALWKSKALGGVAVHCLIVFLTTWLFILPFNPNWWQGVLFIGLTHFAIDATQLYWKPKIPPLARFLIDQMLHFVVLGLALWAGGYIRQFSLSTTLALMQDEQLFLYLLGFAFITMPAWVIIKFLAYGLVQGDAPNFSEGSNKYIGIMERLLITLFVLLGQFLLIPLVAIPRLVMEWPNVSHTEQAPVYLVELLASIAIATLIGLALSQM